MIVGIGPQFEPLLPVKISLPQSHGLIPGQIVDIRLPGITQ